MKKNNQFISSDVQARTELAKRLKSKCKKTRSRAKAQLLEELNGFIWKEIGKWHTYKDFYDDMYQEAVTGVLEEAESYNPAFSLTTYFAFPIKHRIYACVAEQIHGTTDYYFSTGHKIGEVIECYAMQGRKASINDLMRETGYSKGIIENSLVYKYRTINHNISWEAEAEIVENELMLFRQDKNPEDLYLHWEMEQRILAAYRHLDDNHRCVVFSRCKKIPWKKICKKLSLSDYTAKKMYDEGIEQVKNRLFGQISPFIRDLDEEFYEGSILIPFFDESLEDEWYKEENNNVESFTN